MDDAVEIKCGGLCCRRFHIPYTPEELQDGRDRLEDGHQIADMVVPLEPGDPTGWFYTCRNLQEDGLCGVYETRPAMCREYPYGRHCRFPGCPMYVEPGQENTDTVAEDQPAERV